MKGGRFVQLGYTAHYAPVEDAQAITATPAPEISAISPHTVVEGSQEFEIVVEGVGFISESVVRVNGRSLPTTFVNGRTLKSRVPAAVVARAVPNPFMKPGPGSMSAYSAIAPSKWRSSTIHLTEGPPTRFHFE